VIKNIQARIFPFIIALSALSVSASAAFYSVSGLSKLFAGAAFAVIIMAASLEVSKLVIASLLYQYRKNLPKFLKYYLSIACVILILITSMGIYGFLSAAYQETAALAGNVDAQIALIETKRDNVKEQLAVYSDEKESINEAVKDLRSGLSNNVIQYKDKETGEIITTTSSSTRRALEKQLDQAIVRQTEINTRVDNLNQQLFDYETEIVEVTSNANIAGELGPLKYLSSLTGKPMDQIINILLLVIIFVFDPLAIALVVAANFAFEQLKSSKEKPNKELKQAFERHKEEVEEWDEEHAHDMVLNDMVSKLDEEDLKDIEKETKKNVYGEDVQKQLDILNHPSIQNAIKHARRAGEL
jgi:cell division protein FtsB